MSPIPGTNCGCASTAALTLVDCLRHRTYGRYGTLLSEDGSVVIYEPGGPAARWTAAEGTSVLDGEVLGLSADGTKMLMGLGSRRYLYNADLTRTRIDADVRLLSRDGNTAVGVSETSSGVYEIVRWTAEEGVQGTGVVGSVPNGNNGVDAFAVSDDGSVIAGGYYDTSGSTVTAHRPFLWSSSGLVLLDAPSGVSKADGAFGALSADGTTAAGYFLTGTDYYSVFRYSVATGLTVLGLCYSSDFNDCSGRGYYDSGLAFSADGSILAGTMGDPDATSGSAFRYTEAGGSVFLDPDEFTAVRGMSSSGSVVFGAVMTPRNEPSAPFIWDAAHGERLLSTALNDSGADLAGWTLDDAFTLSTDGKVVVGAGTCGGQPALYRAVIPE